MFLLADRLTSHNVPVITLQKLLMVYHCDLCGFNKCTFHIGAHHIMMIENKKMNDALLHCHLMSCMGSHLTSLSAVSH